jgi:hypothetical protein
MDHFIVNGAKGASVTLPAAQVGDEIEIVNNTAGPLMVFASPKDTVRVKRSALAKFFRLPDGWRRESA